jgi:O-antigen ligase
MDLIQNKILTRIKKRLNWVTYFMAFPFWTIYQNVSFFVVIGLYATTSKLYGKLLRVNSLVSFSAYLLILGAISSCINAGINQGYENFEFSITVLPNYIYWGILVVLLGNVVFNVANTYIIYKYIFWGYISSIITYYFLTPIFDPIPFYRNLSTNNFAFILIIFSPIATAYFQRRFNNTLYTVIFILIITLAGFLSGSRSASLLTGGGALIVISINNWLKIIGVLSLGIFAYVALPQVIENPAVKKTVFQLNERTYDLLYSTEETFSTDRSYLTRVAMINKGLNLFESSPIAGIGIGNFQRTHGNIDFSFEGGEFLESRYENLENRISAHNSYISFLSEGGLLMFIPMILLMFYPLIYFIINFNSINQYDKAIFVSIIFMCIHAYFIVGMVNVYAWFLIGIANSYIIYNKKLNAA